MFSVKKHTLMFKKRIGKQPMMQFYCRKVKGLSRGNHYGCFSARFQKFLEYIIYRTPAHSSSCTGSNKIAIF